MGWTRRSVAVNLILAMDEERRRIGARAAQLREGRNLTQEDLAHKAGLSTKTISRFENGRHEGRADTTRRIAEALGVDQTELVQTAPAPLALGEPSQLDRIEDRLDTIAAQVAQLTELIGAPADGNDLAAHMQRMTDRVAEELRPLIAGSKTPAPRSPRKRDEQATKG